jgi:dipeptidyl aminopeptidase/acylaminoacyl peptidase
MKTNLSIATLAALSLACLCPVASAKSEIPITALDSSLHLACVYDDHSLVLMRGDGSNRTEQLKTSGEIISPNWSPDGRKIAFYEVGGRGVPILSSFHVTLCCSDVATKKTDTLTDVNSKIERNADDDKYVVQKPPLWLDSARLVFIDQQGVHLVDIETSDSKLILADDHVRDCVILNRTGAMLISRDKSLIVFDPAAGESRSLFAESETILPKKEIDCIALSPSGTTIALGGWDKLYLVDSAQRKIIRDAKLPGPAHDLIWDPTGRTVFCLTGTDRKRIGGQSIANPTGASAGSFQVSALVEGNENPSVLYKKLRFDVNWTQMSLSPDGRWLLLISNDLNETRHYLYILSTAGDGIRKFVKDGGYAYPVWRP